MLKKLEKWKILVDKSKIFDVLLTGLNKGLTVNIITKLNAYGFTLLILRLIRDYLSNRKQKNRIGNS